MKKQIISTYSQLLFGLFGIISSCSEDGLIATPDTNQKHITEIQDPNFEKKLIELGIDSDGLINQMLLTEDARNISTLVLDSSLETPEEDKIANLKGIEAFEDLVSLSAGNNALTEINLTANQKLTSLHLEANYLQTLDIGHNKQLEDINLILNNLTEINGLNNADQLKTLNLSWNLLESLSVNLPGLKVLNVETNKLKELDVQGCSSLETMIAKLNELETINLSTNTNLKYVTLSANQLKEIDLTNNVSLEKIWLSSNSLKGLDVRNLLELHLLDISKNTNLSCVRIGQNQNILTIAKQDHQELRTSPCD
ncbi:leucine-rich repeat domain-containing protein [Cyclobacterium amurskyense]|uniref:Leucine-rich repeat-containing protein n=1 Tax=Cyclobacterium amurskyense TaxID=320787 RepID=A0A0H4PQL8_9BACT|nr:hypothetical protein [Cyclobacterium amurskyense]AKP50567.1 Leucine-rich repeat-containing protein [Cyclobacterium amurskyense]